MLQTFIHLVAIGAGYAVCVLLVGLALVFVAGVALWLIRPARQ